MNIGIGISLANYRPVPTVPLDPDAAIAALFESGEVGAWYDPSDSTTVFQDSKGVTSAGVGDPVGLILDKSQGLALSAELLTNGTFDADTDWTKGAGWTISGGVATHSPGSASNLVSIATVTSPGLTYKVSFDVSGLTAGNFTVYAGLGGSPSSAVSYNLSSNGSYSVFLIGGTTDSRIYIQGSSACDGSIDNVSVRELPGNHATQTTSAARPVLQQSGATPVLSGSELVTNGTFDTDTSGWTGIACTLSQNAGVLRITDTDGSIGYARQAVAVQVNKTYRVSADVVTDAITGPMYLYVGTTDGSGNLLNVNLSSGTGTLSGVFTATTTTAWVSLRNATAVAGEYWEVDNISVQEVTAWTGGLRYLDFDGVDDWIGSAAFASTESQPNSIGVGFQFDDFTTQAVDVVYDSPTTSVRHVVFDSAGTLYSTAGNPLGFGSSSTNPSVLFTEYNLASTINRRDGVQIATGNAGSFGWSGVLLGVHQTTSQYFLNGRIYSFVGVNRTLTAGEITDLETYLAAKSGVTL